MWFRSCTEIFADPLVPEIEVEDYRQTVPTRLDRCDLNQSCEMEGFGRDGNGCQCMISDLARVEAEELELFKK